MLLSHFVTKLADQGRRHMYHVLEKDTLLIESNVDEFGDSFARNTMVKELKEVVD